MKDVTLTPEEVLAWPHDADLLNARPWHVDWSGTRLADLERLVEHRMPPRCEFHTSGSTGPPRPWELRPEQMLAEVLALGDVLGAGGGIDAVVAFAPPRHRYGAHCSVLLPAALGVPAWVRPRSLGALPPLRGRVLVVGIPSTFAILRHRLAWLEAAASVTVLHSSATLPAAAGALEDEVALAAPGADLSVVELLGSTESGAVATRRRGDDLWTLLPGVSFAGPREEGPADEERLVVRSPWLARAPGSTEDRRVHRLDDVVERHGADRLRLVARAGRFVKVNGVRHHLDEVAARFGAQLRREVACIGVVDPDVGEHFELYVVEPTAGLVDIADDLRRAIDVVGVHPRRVRLVTELVTSSTGKVVSGQTYFREERQ
ncbi:MAG: class I adenylate-forming enzyme family protein [Nocardioides alkalitolerans]